jgi:MoaA/NifB/PqqE/SkfB family radical SAM enzyme
MILVLKGVHFLLSYKCDLECDHCFVWGKPTAKSAFHIEQIMDILQEAKKLDTVTYVSIEGGEPFLYYPVMVRTVREAVKLGLHVEVLSNCYWATCQEDAEEWLIPMAEAKESVELSLSSDLYHGESWEIVEVKNAVKAAKKLGLKVGIIAIKHPSETAVAKDIEGARVGLSELMYKGRAAVKLTEKAIKKPWHEFTRCPYENLADPERVHVDPLGYVHVCQGISIGNAWQKPFSRIIREYKPDENAILEPLIRKGPVALVEKFSLPHDEYYADACHMCFSARCMLRDKYPDTLGPDDMYGENKE